MPTGLVVGIAAGVFVATVAICCIVARRLWKRRSRNDLEQSFVLELETHKKDAI
jgi:hypothetical protein